MTLAYDGTDFHGWQVQPGQRTAQGVLEDALERVLGERVRAHGAGRTDAGVHARGQVASFRAATALPARALVPLLQRELPADVRARDGAEVGEDFHARHSARSRVYRYQLLDDDDLLAGRYGWWPERAVDGAALRAAASPLVGDHDCRTFEAKSDAPGVPVCRIREADWHRSDAGWMFVVAADHFLYHMVRNLVGTMLAALRTSDPAAHVRTVRDAGDRARCGATVPARGLCLERVDYAPAGAAWR